LPVTLKYNSDAEIFIITVHKGNRGKLSSICFSPTLEMSKQHTSMLKTKISPRCSYSNFNYTMFRPVEKKHSLPNDGDWLSGGKMRSLEKELGEKIFVGDRYRHLYKNFKVAFSLETLDREYFAYIDLFYTFWFSYSHHRGGWSPSGGGAHELFLKINSPVKKARKLKAIEQDLKFEIIGDLTVQDDFIYLMVKSIAMKNATNNHTFFKLFGRL
jgi:hypothetical protein